MYDYQAENVSQPLSLLDIPLTLLNITPEQRIYRRLEYKLRKMFFIVGVLLFAAFLAFSYGYLTNKEWYVYVYAIFLMVLFLMFLFFYIVINYNMNKYHGYEYDRTKKGLRLYFIFNVISFSLVLAMNYLIYAIGKT